MKASGSHTAPNGRRLALLIATDEYADPGLGQLRGPAQEVGELKAVLGDPDVGNFTVSVLVNQTAHQVRVAINRMFTTANRNDLVLLHFSGHGVKDGAGRLHFAATDTSLDLLSATGIAADFVRDEVDRSPARQVVLWLDCCFSGAFPAGLVPKSGTGQVNAVNQLSSPGSRGCLVMTATNHVEYAFEIGSDAAPRGTRTPSFFTEAIVEGLRSGDADLNSDGHIDSSELYTYVHERVRSRNPNQTPTHSDRASGPIYLAYSRKGPPLPHDLDPELRAALHSKHPHVRRGATRALHIAATSGDPAAVEALRILTESAIAPLLPTTAADIEPIPAKQTSRRVMIVVGAATVAMALVTTIIVKMSSASGDPDTGGIRSPGPMSSSPTYLISSSSTTSSATSAPASQTSEASNKWVTVRVFNNSTIKGLADKAANDFRSSGWNVNEVTTYSQGIVPTTTAYYRPGTDEEGAAKQLAQEFGILAEPRFEGIQSAAPGVIVIVSKDYRA